MRASWRRAWHGLGLMLGGAWALPLSLPLLLAGAAALPFGARFSTRGPMVVVTGFPIGPRGALALGQVVLTRLPSLDRRVPTYCGRGRVHLGRHELAHVRQSLALGPLFPLLYLLCGGVSARNLFEQAADHYAGCGRGWWPWPRRRAIVRVRPTDAVERC